MAEIRSETLLSKVTEVPLRPSFEGANVGTWIGFKHINYLIEEAVIAHFRRAGYDVRTLYNDYGLCWDVVDIDTRIIHAFNVDEEIVVRVVPAPGRRSGEFCADVVVQGDRDGEPLKLARSRVSVVLRADARWSDERAAIPADLATFVASRIERDAPTSGFGSFPADRIASDVAALTEGRNAFLWKLRIPYFYCHFTERLQMSGYLRVMEEVFDRFLADRGVPIRMLLDEKQLIPAVPRSRISMVDEVYMEEELLTVFVIDDVFKDLTFTARMECYVMRDGALVNVAVGGITHGYGVLEDRRRWGLGTLDDRLLDVLTTA